MAEKIHIEGREISLKEVNDEDYISLTDMVRGMSNSTVIIGNWLRNRNTLEFLALWERIHNPDFNSIEFDGIKNQAGLNTFAMSVKDWVRSTNAIGINSKAGRYGGTYAHNEIAFEFASFISPSFRYMMITDYKRLKSSEYRQHKLEWNETRFLSKINAGILSESIKENLIPKDRHKSRPYATTFDMVNLAIFDMTAKEWRARNPTVKGNIRDSASTIELILISNLESLNAVYIDAGASYEARLIRLYEVASKQRKILEEDKRLNDNKKFIE